VRVNGAAALWLVEFVLDAIPASSSSSTSRPIVVTVVAAAA
jgi:hypothetical protein